MSEPAILCSTTCIYLVKPWLNIVNIKLDLETSPQAVLKLNVRRQPAEGAVTTVTLTSQATAMELFWCRNIPENMYKCPTVFKVTSQALKCSKDELRVILKLMFFKGEDQSE